MISAGVSRSISSVALMVAISISTMPAFADQESCIGATQSCTYAQNQAAQCAANNLLTSALVCSSLVDVKIQICARVDDACRRPPPPSEEEPSQ